MTLHGKMTISDLQRYPLKLWLIKCKLDINLYYKFIALFARSITWNYAYSPFKFSTFSWSHKKVFKFIIKIPNVFYIFSNFHGPHFNSFHFLILISSGPDLIISLTSSNHENSTASMSNMHPIRVANHFQNGSFLLSFF